MRANTITRRTVLLTLAFVAASAVAVAGRVPRFVRPPDPPAYDRAREVTVSGTISEIKNAARNDNGFELEQIVMTTETGPVVVELAPSSYLKARDFGLQGGDILVATGSTTTIENQTVVLAREIRRGESRLVLRDAEGHPEWLKRLREVRFLLAGN